MSYQPTGAAVQHAIQTGAPIPAAFPPSVTRAFDLSSPSLEYTLAAGSVVPDAGSEPFGGSLCGFNRAELYAGHRTFGTPSARRIAQGQGDLPPVQRRAVPGGPSTPEYMNYVPLQSAVDGRHMRYGGTDVYRDEYLGGFIPSASYGVTAAPVRPELLLDTVSIGLSTVKGGEIVNPRPFVPQMVQPALNLVPLSESAATRSENACRLNRMHKAMVAQQLAAASSSDFPLAV